MRVAVHVFFGFTCASVIAVLAILFGGAGHGWSSGIYSAFPSFLGAPLAAAAWAASRRTIAFGCAVSSLLIGLGTDVYLVFRTLEEGISYFGKVWDAAPIFLIAWVLLFIGWQLLAFLSLFKNQKIEPDGAANGSQPIRSETHRTSSAAGSRR